jgi:hypothetical protein
MSSINWIGNAITWCRRTTLFAVFVALTIAVAGAIDRRIGVRKGCLMSFGLGHMPVGLEKSRVDCVKVDYITVNCTISKATTGVAIAF